MTTVDEAQVFLAKAEESLAGAASERANGRYHNCANRCYYACFQAAIAALMRAGIRASGREGRWSHAYVQAQFAGELIARRKLYPATLRETLTRTYLLRETADYKVDQVSSAQAERAMRRTLDFVTAVRDRMYRM
jgi:uncharacterized protein (UPF0332 family)